MRSGAKKIMIMLAALLILSVPCHAEQAPAELIASDVAMRINQFRENLVPNIVDFSITEGITIESLPSWVWSLSATETQVMAWNPVMESVLRDRISSDPDQESALKDFSEHLRENGYESEKASEARGTALFMNFMPSFVAAEVLFKNLVKKDLLQHDMDNVTILNPARMDFALAVCPGSAIKEGLRYNAYRLAVGSAIPVSLSNEAWITDSLLVMMNQARMAPVKTCEFLGLDFSAVSWIYPFRYFFTGAPRIVRPEVIEAKPMEGESQGDQPDRSVMNFFIEAQDLPKEEIVKKALFKIIEMEQISDPESRIIYRSEDNSESTSISISTKFGLSQDTGAEGYFFSIAVIPYLPEYDNNASGAVYMDSNLNGFMDPGEGLESCDVVSGSGEKMNMGKEGTFTGIPALNPVFFDASISERICRTPDFDWTRRFVLIEAGALVQEQVDTPALEE